MRMLPRIALPDPRAWVAAGALLGALAAPWTPACLAQIAKPELLVGGSRGGERFNAPQGIAVNPATGEIILANTNDHRIEIYSAGGRLLTRFPHAVSQDGMLVEGLPQSLAATRDGHIVVADARAPYVDILDYRGRSVARLKTPVPPGAGGLSAVAVTREGAILAAAPGDQGRIFTFTPEHTLLRTWGVPGLGAGQLSSITAIAELPDGSIAVTCAQTELAVQVFEPTGEYVRGFGRHDIGVGNFSLPSGITATSDGRIWVSDELRQLVQVFDSDGRYIGALGRGGIAPGEFLYPCALATDGGNRLAVAESVGARFQVFSITARGGPETGAR